MEKKKHRGVVADKKERNRRELAGREMEEDE